MKLSEVFGWMMVKIFPVQSTTSPKVTKRDSDLEVKKFEERRMK